MNLRHMSAPIFAACLIALTCAAWGPSTVPALPAFPDLPAGAAVEKGIKAYDVPLTRAGVPMRLRIYLPDPPAKDKIGCVFVAPAGTRLFHGIKLGDGDEKEVLPYVRAGFAGVSYDVDGDLPEKFTNPQAFAAAKAFMAADSGVANARTAIDYVFAKVPAVDPKRLFTAGHSSAATISLLVASHDHRIAAAIAYAPCTDVVGRLRTGLALFEKNVPGFTAFLTSYSPDHCVKDLACPVFVFHAQDDSNVKYTESVAFAAAAQQAKVNIKLDLVPTGNHYESMIKQGIPDGIKWLKAMP